MPGNHGSLSSTSPWPAIVVGSVGRVVVQLSDRDRRAATAMHVECGEGAIPCVEEGHIHASHVYPTSRSLGPIPRKQDSFSLCYSRMCCVPAQSDCARSIPSFPHREGERPEAIWLRPSTSPRLQSSSAPVLHRARPLQSPTRQSPMSAVQIRRKRRRRRLAQRAES